MSKKQCITQVTMDKIREEFKDDKEILDDISHIKTCSKRKTSPYQEFVGVCLRSGKSIKECAAEWRKKKGE